MDLNQSLSLICENMVEVLSKEELEARLKKAKEQKRPLRIKAGFDPSAPDIHLGHTVLLRKLRTFQDLGHKIIFIIGDYTAMIGDPTGKTQTRPALSRDEVVKNSKTYQKQAFKILDANPKKIEIVYNSQWFFKKDMFRIFLEKVGTQYTVARLLERDDFEKRMASDQPITVREFIYPLLQGYDSVMVRSDIEIGGTDQKFNLIVGRNLQRAFHQEPQIVMTLPLLVGTDGSQKMSKSLGNHIGVLDPAKEMFGKVMSIPDSLMPAYAGLLTALSAQQLSQKLQSGEIHPRDAKKKLATEIVRGFYGDKKAVAEAEEFDRIFKEKQVPSSLEELQVSGGEIWIVDLLKMAKAVESGGQARALIEQGAVSIDGEKITDSKAKVMIREGSILKAGKRHFLRLVLRH